jgi:hypothetical protein
LQQKSAGIVGEKRDKKAKDRQGKRSKKMTDTSIILCRCQPLTFEAQYNCVIEVLAGDWMPQGAVTRIPRARRAGLPNQTAKGLGKEGNNSGDEQKFSRALTKLLILTPNAVLSGNLKPVKITAPYVPAVVEVITKPRGTLP